VPTLPVISWVITLGLALFMAKWSLSGRERTSSGFILMYLVSVHSPGDGSGADGLSCSCLLFPTFVLSILNILP
jgi:hypothetical protein